jgi:hypothetical protein
MAADLGSAAEELAKVEHFMGVTQVGKYWASVHGHPIAWTHGFDLRMPAPLAPPRVWGTQMTDQEVCRRILEAHAWNLEAAVHTALGMSDLRAADDEGTRETPTAAQLGFAGSGALSRAPPNSPLPLAPRAVHTFHTASHTSAAKISSKCGPPNDAGDGVVVCTARHTHASQSTKDASMHEAALPH